LRVYDIALKNLNRRKGRVAFLASALAIAIGTVVTLFSLTKALQESVGAQLDQYGANIIVLPRSETLSVSYGGFNLSGISYDVRALTDQDVEGIQSIPYRNRLSVVAPKLLRSVVLAGNEYVVAGVDFPRELRLKQWWEVEGRRPENADEVLVGYVAAKQLGLIEPVAENRISAQEHSHAPPSGQSFRLVARPLSIAGRDFRVSGVIRETGTQEDRFIFADLKLVQQLFQSPGEITLVEISALCNGCPIEAIVGQIAAGLPNAQVSAVQQAVKARMQTVEKLVKFSYVLAAIVLLIAFLVVTVSTMSSISERTREIGILRAVGFRNTHVLQMLFTEITAVSLLGGVLGCLAGLVSAVLASPYFVEAAVRVRPDSRLFLVSLTLALFVGLLASVYPASRAARLDPVEALRSL